jgi:putative serine protease PepD
MGQNAPVIRSSTRSMVQHVRKRSWRLVIGAGVAVVALGVGVGIATPAGGATSNSNCSAAKIAAKGLPSVVMISVQAGRSGGTGSGEVIRANGEILTNNHVIAAAANGGSISVLFSDGTTAGAHLVGRDPLTDLAVIKVDSTGNKLPVIEFGQSAKLAIGEPVVALGAPLGYPNTATSGIVSALDRSVQVPADNGQTALLVAAIQTDAAINPGNSGGALLDCNARLIGVPSAGAVVPTPSGGSAGNIGIGFAIPADFAKQVSDEIISTGTVTHSSFGIQVAPVVPAVGGEPGVSTGLYVVAVSPGGPTDAAGIQAGDVITKINGKPATSAEQLQELTLTKRAGDTVTITYERNGTSHTTTVTLAAASPSS